MKYEVAVTKPHRKGDNACVWKCTDVLFGFLLQFEWVKLEEIAFCNKRWWILNVMWMQLITVVTVEAEKGLCWIKSLLCEWTVSSLAWDRCLFWHDQTGSCVCVCARLVQLLSLPPRTHELGPPNQHAWHFEEEANCWKQAPHLDYLDPCIELCPEPLLFSPKPRLVHSSVALMSPKASKHPAHVSKDHKGLSCVNPEICLFKEGIDGYS